MIFFRTLPKALIAGLMIIVVGAYVEIPSVYRMATPTFFGLKEVSPGFYIDNPNKAPEVRSLIRKSRTNASRFFGPLDVEPRYVICTTQECIDKFGTDSYGLVIGYHYMLISPKGINERTITHEVIHIALHSKMEILENLFPRIPFWFDEGLASYLSGDNPGLRIRDPRRSDWITTASNWSTWTAMSRHRPAAEMYGAAATLVAEIDRKLGRHGLKKLVDDVAAGADFDEEYAKLGLR